MSDELLFDSERLEQRENRKRKLLPFLVLAGIIVLAVVLALLLRSGKGEIHTGGEETDYPFTWTLKSDGNVELTVPHADAPDSRWVLKDGEESLPALRIERYEKESNGGTVFAIHPEAEGRTLFTLVLTDQGENAAKRYEMILLAEVTQADGRLNAGLLNATGNSIQGELNGGEESENAYRIFTNDEGLLVVSVVTGEYETDWDYQIPVGAESLELLGMIYEDDHVNTYLRAGETPGAVELVLNSEYAGAELRLSLEAKADGSLQVLSHEASYGEKIEFISVKDVTEPAIEEEEEEEETAPGTETETEAAATAESPAETTAESTADATEERAG